MCDDVNVVNHIRELGFNAELYSSEKAEKIKSVAGVFVVHQAKEHFPVKFKNEVVILNLWHGVGIKPIERFVDSPGIKYRTYKNILNTMTYIIITNYFSHFPINGRTFH